jgi:hypothetical protein
MTDDFSLVIRRLPDPRDQALRAFVILGIGASRRGGRQPSPDRNLN